MFLQPVADTPVPGQRVLTLDAAAPFVDANLAGGPVRLRVDPGARAYILLNKTTAKRLELGSAKRVVGALLGLRAFQPMIVQVGRVQVAGYWSAERLKMLGARADVRVAWFGQGGVADADGVISPALLPYDIVRFVRYERGEDYHDAMLPVRFVDWHGLQGSITVGGKAVDVELSLATPHTIATAAAGAAIATAFDGKFAGPREAIVVAHGVTRPVQTIELARPLEVAGLAIEQFLVRVADWRGDNALPAEGKPSSDEIVVTGRNDLQRPWLKLVLGGDAVRNCSEVSYYRQPQRLVLTCAYRQQNGSH